MQVITLSLDRVNSIASSMQTYTKTVKKSSLAKAVVGGAVFGVPGAIIGAKPKEKHKTAVQWSIVVIYDGNKEVVVKTFDTIAMSKIIKEFKKIHGKNAISTHEL